MCRCTKTFGRFFFISEDLSPCLSLYIVGLNLARRYCVYLAALFCTKLGLEEAGVHLVPPVKKKKKISVTDDVELHPVLFKGEILFF